MNTLPLLPNLVVALVLFTSSFRAPAATEPASREFTITKRYLNLPVKNGAEKKRVALHVDGRVAREFEIELASRTPDFWVFLDLADFKGKRVLLTADLQGTAGDGLNAVYQDDKINGQDTLYTESLRPQFHFSSRRGWNNDPNGLVFYKGEYHLFYQHNPYGWDWGNMHWGHAVGRDPVHWTERPIALYPRQFGDWAFSGSAVVDWDNTAGFKTGRDDVIVIAYTSTGRGECIVYSNDRGRSWTEYPGNPVVKHQGRDPKLLWYAPTKRWVMAVYDELDKGKDIAFYTSADLKQWHYQSRIAGFYECPDLFELPVGGSRRDRKWVLTAANSDYLIGSFDGAKFSPESSMLKGHRGEGFYAAQTYSDIPAQDGRRIQIGWGRVAAPGMPFNQMMFFPTELGLLNTEEGPRLAWQPARELRKLRGTSHKWRNLSAGMSGPLDRIRGDLLELRATLPASGEGSVRFLLRGIDVSWNPTTREIACRGKKATVPKLSGQTSETDLIVLLDRTSIELFAAGGLVYMPMPVKPRSDAPAIAFTSENPNTRLPKLEVHELRSIWAKK